MAVPIVVLGIILGIYVDKKTKSIKKSKNNLSNTKNIVNSYNISKVVAEKPQEILNCSQNNKLQQSHNEEVKENFKENYVIPEGKEISYFRTINTRVRGVYYYNICDEDLSKNDKVAIIHNPKNDYHENTDIISIPYKILLGHLMKEMAAEFVEKYGQNFCFIGKVIDFEREEDDEDGMIDKIIIQFDVPSFRKKSK